MRVEVPINSAPQFFTFQADTAEPFCPTTLTVTAETPGFEFAVKIRDDSGELITQLRGGNLQENRTTVQANTGEYEVEVLAADPITQGAVYLIVTCADEAPICDALGGLSVGDTVISTPPPPVSGDDDDDDGTITPTPFIPLGDDDDDELCDLALTSPTDGLAYGSQDFYWMQTAGSAPGGYRVSVYGGVGCGPGPSGTTGATTINLDLSSLGGACFSATWQVDALAADGTTVLCSDAMTLPREAQGDDDDDDDGTQPFCGDGTCNGDENANTCTPDCQP
ncbi:MAG: hypothetical protein H7175_20630 [Burkholderiales bacterium]|nr:hypothetical protein [Anaerolineae bacterium]